MQELNLRGCTPITRRLGLAVVLVSICSMPARSLDLSNDRLVYQEDFNGEISFPTTAELDLIAAGGLRGGSDSSLLGPPPSLTGTSVHESTSASNTLVEAVFFLSGTIDTDSFSLRGEFSGLSVPSPKQAILQLFGSFNILPGGTDLPSFAVWVVLNSEDLPVPASVSIAVVERDGIPPPTLGVDNFLELPLPAAETAALLAGAAFVVDFRADRVAETLTGSIDITGFPSHTIGPMPLLFIDDTADVIIAGQALILTSSPPGTIVEVDVEAFEVDQIRAVPVLSPGGMPLLVALLLGTAWWQTRRGRFSTSRLDKTHPPRSTNSFRTASILQRVPSREALTVALEDRGLPAADPLARREPLLSSGASTRNGN